MENIDLGYILFKIEWTLVTDKGLLRGEEIEWITQVLKHDANNQNKYIEGARG